MIIIKWSLLTYLSILIYAMIQFWKSLFLPIIQVLEAHWHIIGYVLIIGHFGNHIFRYFYQKIFKYFTLLVFDNAVWVFVSPKYSKPEYFKIRFWSIRFLNIQYLNIYSGEKIAMFAKHVVKKRKNSCPCFLHCFLLSSVTTKQVAVIVSCWTIIFFYA